MNWKNRSRGASVVSPFASDPWTARLRAINRGCPSAVTARVTAKRCSLDALTLAEGLLDAALSPCHGAPRTRGCRGGTHTVSSPGLHRASLVSATLRWSGETKGRRRDKDSLGAPHVYLGPGGSIAPFSGFQMDELRDAIALLFKRKGRDELSEREFVLSASMDLRWFPPRDAQRLLQLGLETKLLESQSGTIRPAFDVSAVEVPRSRALVAHLDQVAEGDAAPGRLLLDGDRLDAFLQLDAELPFELADERVARADCAGLELRDDADPFVDLRAEIRLFPSAGLPRLANPLGEVFREFEFAGLGVHVPRGHASLSDL